MKKIIVVVLLLFVVGHPPRADANTTTDKVMTKTTVTFIANPNLPKPPAPGLPPGNAPNEVITPTGMLPKTGATQNNTIPVGTALILLATLLYSIKKRAR